MKRKDILIGMRCYDFLIGTFGSLSKAETCSGIKESTLLSWKHGATPGGFYLQKLVYLGADPRWLLTGRSEVKK